MLLSANGQPSAPPSPIDWIAVKAAIVSKLDIVACYSELGLRWADSGGAGEWRSCHSMDRPDDSPSAAVNVKTGLYKDFGGIADAFTIKNHGSLLDLFSFGLKYGSFGSWINTLRHYAQIAGVPLGSIPTHSKGRIRENVYDYRDANNQVVYAVFRYRMPNGKKEFTQHPPDGRGGWKIGPGCMRDVQPVPYRLPELLASAETDDPIFIVEGEMNADRLAVEGLTATTNHGGSNATDHVWPKFLEHFRDRTCFIIPDNDPPGRAHADKVCRVLKPVAAEVKLLPLDNLPPKGDVVDWLALGGTIDELCKLAFAAPIFDPDSTAVVNVDDSGRVATLADVRKVCASLNYLWPGWIVCDAVNILAAPAGVGKTRFLADLWRRVMTGGEWPDGTPIALPDHLSSRKILFVAGDLNFSQLLNIFPAFDVPDEFVHFNSFADDATAGTMLNLKADFEALDKRVEQIKPTLVVIDSVSTSSLLDMKDMAESTRFFTPLAEIAVRRRIPILGIMHLAKDGGVFGIRALERARVVMKLALDPDDPESNRRRLWVDKSLDKKPAPLGVTMGETGSTYDLSPPPIATRNDGGFQAKRSGGSRPSPARDAAVKWLKEQVGERDCRVSHLINAAKEKGISIGKLYEAKEIIDLMEYQDDHDKKWWRLETDSAVDSQPVKDEDEGAPF